MSRLATRPSNTEYGDLFSTGNAGSLIGTLFDPPTVTRSDRCNAMTLSTSASDPQFLWSFNAGEVSSQTPTLLSFGVEQLRVDTVSFTSGSPTVTDTSITVNDQFRAVGAAASGIPAGSYVGTVTPGVSFLLSSSPTAQINVNATVTRTNTPANISTFFQGLFEGQVTRQFDPGGSAWSDPVYGLDTSSGETWYVRPYQRAAAGVVALVNGSNILVGATSFTIDTMPAITAGAFRLCNNVSATTTETVQVLSITGASSPFTVTLAAGTKFAHSVGDRFGGALFTNSYQFSDQGGGSVSGGTDNSVSGTFPALSNAATTLQASTAIGDTQMFLIANDIGTVLTVDTAGNAETVTMHNSGTVVSPFQYKLTSALTKTHSSGVAVTGNIGYTQAFRPAAIVSRRIQGPRPKTVLSVGNSIPSGTAPYTRLFDSYLVFALGNTVPLINTSKAGDNWGAFEIFQNSKGRRQLWGFADWMHYQLGVNDALTFTLAQMQAGHTYMWQLARKHGLKIVAETMTPRSNSTDGFVTTTNQTVYDATRQSVNLQYNSWVRAGAGGLIDLYIDMAKVTDSGLVAGGADTGIWRVDNGDNYTLEGLHVSYVGHQAMTQAPVFIPAGPQIATLATLGSVL